MRAPGSSTCSPDNACSLIRGNRTDSSWTRDQEQVALRAMQHRLQSLTYVQSGCAVKDINSYPWRAQLPRRLIPFSSRLLEFCTSNVYPAPYTSMLTSILTNEVLINQMYHPNKAISLNTQYTDKVPCRTDWPFKSAKYPSSTFFHLHTHIHTITTCHPPSLAPDSPGPGQKGTRTHPPILSQLFSSLQSLLLAPPKQTSAVKTAGRTARKGEKTSLQEHDSNWRTPRQWILISAHSTWWLDQSKPVGWRQPDGDPNGNGEGGVSVCQEHWFVMNTHTHDPRCIVYIHTSKMQL